MVVLHEVDVEAGRREARAGSSSRRRSRARRRTRAARSAGRPGSAVGVTFIEQHRRSRSSAQQVLAVAVLRQRLAPALRAARRRCSPCGRRSPRGRRSSGPAAARCVCDELRRPRAATRACRCRATRMPRPMHLARRARPRSRYARLTSVISSSPRARGLERRARCRRTRLS